MKNKIVLLALGGFLAIGAGRLASFEEGSIADGKIETALNQASLVAPRDVSKDVDKEIFEEGDQLPALDVVWEDDADKESKSNLSFTVTNTTEETLVFSVDIAAESIIGSGVLSLGPDELGSGESASYTVKAKDLPVRSASAMSSVSVRITRSVMTPRGLEDRVEDLANRFIEHEKDYGKARAFDEKALRDERGGLLVNAPVAEGISAESTSEEEVGEVWDGKAFKKKAKKDSGLFVRDDEGDVCGVVTEMRMGAMSMNEIPGFLSVATNGTDSTDEEVKND